MGIDHAILDKHIGQQEVAVYVRVSGSSPSFRAIISLDADPAKKASELRGRIEDAIRAVYGEPYFAIDGVEVQTLSASTIGTREERREKFKEWVRSWQPTPEQVAERAAENEHRLDKNPDNGKQGFWYVSGIRNAWTVAASNEREAINKAIDSGEVGDWESPSASFIGTEI